MLLGVHQLLLSLDYQETDIRKAVAQKLSCDEKDLDNLEIARRSIDAREQRGKPVVVLSVRVELKRDCLPEGAQDRDVEFLTDKENTSYTLPSPGIYPSTRLRPIVVGAGPAGLMASLALAEAGLSPLIFERGAPVADRTTHVMRYWKKGELNPESNLLFGEGGAGLFSDGKLTARNKDRLRVRYFLQRLVSCGAPSHILIDAEPHLGSDMLAQIVPAMRRLIEKAGGEIHFHARFEGLEIEKGVLRGIRVNGQTIEGEACILATGHSARDVYMILSKENVPMAPKDFAVGMRLELPQKRIDRAQWGRWADHPRLKAGTFRLTRRKETESRACYTFCMCPGGRVMACASSPETLTTNGMSDSNRAGAFGNAAFLVPVGLEDFPVSDINGALELAGIEFQTRIERAAFKAGGSDYSLPAAFLKDFISGKTTNNIPAERSCPRARPSDLHSILPSFISDTLSVTIPKMLRLLKGVRLEEVLVYAPETRSSSPVRILRNEKGQSLTVRGLFPAGEGAGYAGGIVSSAVDGLRAAEAIINNYY